MTHLVPLTFQNLDDMDRGRVGLLFRKVLTDALNRQMHTLGNILHETGAPVFYGRP